MLIEYREKTTNKHTVKKQTRNKMNRTRNNAGTREEEKNKSAESNDMNTSMFKTKS